MFLIITPNLSSDLHELSTGVFTKIDQFTELLMK